MMRVKTAGAPISAALLFVAMLLAPHAAGAQAVGAGPLTGKLTDTEPTVGVLTIARVKLAPGVVVREIGWDNNVFDEAVDPKEDFVASVMPDVSAFMRLRFIQVSAYGGSDLNYYRTYEGERSVGHSVSGRVDLLLGRLKPFFGGGSVLARTRPNGEIDVRADRGEVELSTGVAFDLSQFSSVFGGVTTFKTEYRDAFEENVDLAQTLNRDVTNYAVGLRTALTPLLTLTMTGAYGEDRFKSFSLRNAESYSASAALRFGAEAVVSGLINVGVREFRPVDPAVARFRGITGTLALTYPFLEIGRVALVASRSLDFSFDVSEAYFIENTATLTYTHRLFRGLDGQARASMSLFDYGYHQNTPTHTDRLDSAGGSIGYNLANRTRIAANYEYARRRSPAYPERNYQKRRAFLSWTFAF